MAWKLADSPRIEALVAQALTGRLDEAQAHQLARLDPELLALSLLALTRRIGELQGAAAGTKHVGSAVRTKLEFRLAGLVALLIREA